MDRCGVYLHIPFCRSRCSYCDFATDVYRSDEIVERYVDALCSEIRDSRFEIRTVAGTVYFGGGTPSLLSPQQVERILAVVRSKFDVTENPEITLEINPATATPERLAAFHLLGVNRASFGVQTFNDHDLKLLGRGHDAQDARATFGLLRDAGFDNVSFDLIAGLPGQTLSDWRANLDEAIAMCPEHLSLYLLEIHEGTPLAEQVRSGRRPLPDPEVAAEMYEVMVDQLCSVGYRQYEISNFAKPGFESCHNSKYWRLEPVFGFGVSAHSFDGEQRYSNHRDTAEYVSIISSGGSAEVMRESINAASEFVFLGLRLERGIDLIEYEERFASDLRQTHSSALADLDDLGLVELTQGRLRLTGKGMLFSNEVFAYFV